MLDQIQAHLEAIYGIRCAYRAADFVVDGEAALRLGRAVRAREELLVLEGEDELELALYLEPALLARVSRFEERPTEALDAELGGFCEVAEGVSHFLYLSRAADLERRVSLLELEAQAEVDKFVVCTLLRWGSGVARWAGSMAERLFERVGFHPHLNDAERWRYREANRVARRYAGRLLPLIRAGNLEGLLAELRHVYRLGAEAKLQYLAR